MNNGVNNSELSIEPVVEPAEQQVTTQIPVVEPVQSEQSTQAPIVEAAQPTVAPVAEPSQPQVVEAAQPTVQQTTQPEPTQSLGSNVRIAPAQPMYDENDNVIAQPEPTPPPRPVVTQPTPPVPGEPPQVQIKQEEVPTPQNDTTEQTPQQEQAPAVEQVTPKRKLSLTPLFLIIIVVLIGYMIYTKNDALNELNELKYQNIVINTNGDKVDLDKNSTLIQDLYTKVATTVREDIANPNLDDEMKRYLAYRQINSNKIYESQCNLFDQNKIYNYTCDDKEFKPTAFKEETLDLEIKKIFGENSEVEKGNIQLGRQCIGGYEYIAERGEYVQGQCLENNAVTISVKKEIISAYRINDEIIIEEETKYISGNKGDIPSILKDGIYIYTFKLDTNLNYAYISKDYRTKY